MVESIFFFSFRSTHLPAWESMRTQFLKETRRKTEEGNGPTMMMMTGGLPERVVRRILQRFIRTNAVNAEGWSTLENFKVVLLKHSFEMASRSVNPVSSNRSWISKHRHDDQLRKFSTSTQWSIYHTNSRKILIRYYASFIFVSSSPISHWIQAFWKHLHHICMHRDRM